MSDAANVEKSPKKPTLKYVFAGVAAVLVMIVAAFTVLVCMVFSSPEKTVTVKPSAMDFYCQGRIANKLYRQLRKKPDEINSLRLKEHEVNSAIRCAVYYQEQISKKRYTLKLSDIGLVYKNGVFCGTIPLDTGIRLFNGGVIAVKFTAKISKTAERIKIDVLTAKAGKISLPASKVNQYVSRVLEDRKVKDNLSKLDSTFETISVEPDGQLKLTYYPADLIKAVINR